mmetsp:Transcript_21468/g.52895  ORF Transcript_21468/g.52895 Transcript_21468/m.52895 type:complete len:252 (+) Transcript_21468:419-1174(+)
MESLRKWQSSPLISQYFVGFIPEIIRLGAVGCNFFGILHPFDLIILIGTTDKSHWVAFRVGTLNKHACNLLLGHHSAIWDTISKEPSGNAHVGIGLKRITNLFQCWCCSRCRSGKGCINSLVSVHQKGLGVPSLSGERHTVLSIQKDNFHLIKGDIRQNFNHFLQALVGFGPTSLGTTENVDGIGCQRHTTRVVYNNFKIKKEDGPSQSIICENTRSTYTKNKPLAQPATPRQYITHSVQSIDVPIINSKT